MEAINRATETEEGSETVERNVAAAVYRRVGVERGAALPAFAWPGGYPIYYLDAEGSVLCPDCANRNHEYTARLEDAAIIEEGGVICDQCGATVGEGQ